MDQTNRDVGIVLSGGGSRGLAHIGVLRALGERGIFPGRVAGASAGAIVGALYAAGYTPAEMLTFFLTKNPFQFSKLAINKPGIFDAAKIGGDFEEYFPDDSFEALDKQLTVVATDMTRGRQVVFESGPLIPAVLASASVPFVFTPTEIAGQPFSDGGIVNNFPVELLTDRCRVIFGVYVSVPQEIPASQLTNSLSLFRRALEIGMFHASNEKFRQCDVVLCPTELNRFSVFETKQLEKIEAVGYESALARMDEFTKAVSGIS